MLRFIIEVSEQDNISGSKGIRFETMDVDVPILEDTLISGGHSESGHLWRTLKGVEVLKPHQRTLAPSQARTPPRFGEEDQLAEVEERKLKY